MTDVAKNGVILVSQLQDTNIRVFDATGKAAGTIGKRHKVRENFKLLCGAQANELSSWVQ